MFSAFKEPNRVGMAKLGDARDADLAKQPDPAHANFQWAVRMPKMCR